MTKVTRRKKNKIRHRIDQIHSLLDEIEKLIEDESHTDEMRSIVFHVNDILATPRTSLGWTQEDQEWLERGQK